MRTPTPSRFCRGLAAAVLAVATVACVSGGGRRAPAVTAPAPPAGDSAASPLEGEWRLTSLQLGDGSTRRVSGYLRFDRFSNITLHAELTPDDPAARPPRTIVAAFTAKAEPEGGTFAYAGLAPAVGPERLTEDAVNMAEWRHYELAGDTLRVSARGGRQATLVFQRAR